MVIIGLADEKQIRQKALDFIDEHYFKRFDTHPLPAQHVFVARSGQNIIGTSALDFGDGERLLPVELIYDINCNLASQNAKRVSIAQYGRWISTVRGISQCLLYASAIYALEHGKIYAWSEMKDVIATIFRNLGVKLSLVPKAKLNLANIPKYDLPYYLASPPPKLYSMKWQQVKTTLEPTITQMIADKKIKLI